MAKLQACRGEQQRVTKEEERKKKGSQDSRGGKAGHST